MVGRVCLQHIEVLVSQQLLNLDVLLVETWEDQVEHSLAPLVLNRHQMIVTIES
jgi:hypothetical protein